MPVGIYKKTARDVMTRHVATIRASESVHDALQTTMDILSALREPLAV